MPTNRIWVAALLALSLGWAAPALITPAPVSAQDAPQAIAKPDPVALLGSHLALLEQTRALVERTGKGGEAFHEAAVFLGASMGALQEGDPRGAIYLVLQSRAQLAKAHEANQATLPDALKQDTTLLKKHALDAYVAKPLAAARKSVPAAADLKGAGVFRAWRGRLDAALSAP